jgi:uncharacterized protein
VKWAVLLLALLAPGVEAAAPSFDCARAESAAEKLVCSDAALGALDQELARLFALARDDADLPAEQRSTLVAMQRGWIKGRDDCWKADDLRACVEAEYLSRILALRQESAVARSDDAAGISLGPFAVTCEGFAQPIELAIVKTHPELAWLEWPDGFLVLTQTVSGSGVRYTAYGGETVFWMKGKEAMFDRPGAPDRACRIE